MKQLQELTSAAQIRIIECIAQKEYGYRKVCGIILLSAFEKEEICCRFFQEKAQR